MKLLDLLVGTAAATLMLAGCAGQAPPWARADTAPYGVPIVLPPPETSGSVPLEQALAGRRSTRSFRPDSLPIQTLGQLLWAGQGITGPDGKRTAPSAGALYPLELYVLTPSELIHYLPQGNRIEIRPVPDLRPRLQEAAFGQSPVGAAPVVMVVAAAPDRTRQKYGARADTYVELEAGHAAQNILLEAAALDLAAVPIGSLNPSRAAETLALPPDQTVLYLIPVGLRT